MKTTLAAVDIFGGKFYLRGMNQVNVLLPQGPGDLEFRPVAINEYEAIVRLVFAPATGTSAKMLVNEAFRTIQNEPKSQRLWGAYRVETLVAGAWISIHPGGVASLWPPGKIPAETADTIAELLRVVHASLPEEVQLTQCLLEPATANRGDWLRAAGFEYSTDLLYLACESPAKQGDMANNSVEFESLSSDQPEKSPRLLAIVEQTYAGTCDCPQLNGLRTAADTLASYRAIGRFDAENWLIVRHEERDVGCLILAEHPADRNLELVYMGIVPEARGRGLGEVIVRHAQGTAKSRGCERLVLAVDAANEPALAIYGRAGLQPWDRRHVYLRWRR